MGKEDEFICLASCGSQKINPSPFLSPGYGDVEPIFQGSSVTGQSFKAGQAFDAGRVSDFDVALASPELL